MSRHQHDVFKPVTVTTPSMVGTDTTSAIQRPTVSPPVARPTPASRRRHASFVQRKDSDGGAAMIAWMSDLSVREQRSPGAIQQGLERQRLNDRQVVRARLVGQPGAVLEDPPVHQPMAVLER
jgi:hypothetical protein